MATQPPPISGRARARTWMLVNLFLWPGLGSWQGGRRVSGALQMAVSLLGAGVALVWFIRLLLELLRAIQGTRAEPSDLWRLAFTGFGLVALAWLWSLVTSLALLREAESEE
ncbi:MAG: hypothetical protein HY301_08440 [Verrucomicrobia bacterium]|nr:hypothetical protein [Verrucomicrobiota bacterium]